MCPDMEVSAPADRAIVRRRWPVRTVDAQLRARLAAFALLWPLGVATGAVVMAILRLSGLSGFRFWAFIALGELVALLIYATTARRRRSVGVEDDSLLVVDDGGAVRKRLPAADIEGVLVVSRGERTWLEVQSRGRALPLIGVESSTEAQALIEALRWSTTRAGQRLRLYSPTGELLANALGLGLGFFLGGVIGLYASAAGSTPLMLIPWIVLGALGGLGVAWTTIHTIHVGADGLCVRSRSGLSGARFIPYREIDRLAIKTHGSTTTLLLHQRSGDMLSLMRSGDRARVVALRNALTATVAAFALQPGAADQDALLPTSERFEDWTRRLRGLADGEAGYRESLISDEVLLLVARSAGAPTLARLGAAFVLAQRGREAARPLSDVADELADPALRKAIQTLSRGPSDGKAMNKFFLSESSS